VSWTFRRFRSGAPSSHQTAPRSPSPSFADCTSALAAARVLGATLKAGETVELGLDPSRHVYLVAVGGAIEVNGRRAEPRDGVAVTGEETLTISAVEEAEIVLVDAR